MSSVMKLLCWSRTKCQEKRGVHDDMTCMTGRYLGRQNGYGVLVAHYTLCARRSRFEDIVPLTHEL